MIPLPDGGFFKACLTGIIATVVSLIFLHGLSSWWWHPFRSRRFVSFATALLFMGVIAFILPLLRRCLPV